MPDDGCVQYNGPERRTVCSDLLLLRQRFEDQEEAREIWRSAADRKFESIERTQQKILNSLDKLLVPYQFGVKTGWLFIGAVVVGIVTLMGYGLKFIWTHLKL